MNSAQNKNNLLKDKRVIITGPTSGIGKEIAIQLAALGAELVLACRDLERGKRTVEEIARCTGMKNCEVIYIDTSSRQSMHEFAQKYRQKYSRLDVLINNAGIHRTRRQMSVDGVELTFATNVLGYFILTQELLEILKASAPARIVNVASTFASDLDLDDLQFDRRPFVGMKAYAQSKACDRMLTWALARRIEGSGVTANAMAPGLVQTGLYRDTRPSLRFLLRIIGIFHGRNVIQGADTAVWLASSSEVEGHHSCFFERRQEVACKFRNTDAEEKLWSICEKLTGSL